MQATTRLLTQTLGDTPRHHRWAAAASVVTIAICAIVITLIATRTAPEPALASRIIILATPTMQPPTVTPAPARPDRLVAFFNYQDTASASMIDATTVACVVGQAEQGAWLYVILGTCAESAPHVWMPAARVPSGAAIVSLADLTPPTPAPLPPRKHGPGIYQAVNEPAQIAPAPEAAPEQAAEPPTAAPPVPTAAPRPTLPPGWGGGGGSGWDEAATDRGDFVCYGSPRVCYPVAK
jgi:hypothetical protein